LIRATPTEQPADPQPTVIHISLTPEAAEIIERTERDRAAAYERESREFNRQQHEAAEAVEKLYRRPPSELTAIKGGAE
jgi:hypothetical protein